MRDEEPLGRGRESGKGKDEFRNAVVFPSNGYSPMTKQELRIELAGFYQWNQNQSGIV